ncbi:phosphotransferase [Mycobacterium crocinum]|uniref:Phosphotransferase n=1 Tax=Mycolicibacterium crocinum TaxID=388459 RepID=A0ABY3TT75_9MYCO|nr:phosphotransferase [Mycolicibacterium crocinum]APE16373.1 LPS biosynthesis choline kinase [Mycobacterium sp. WY10]MCV7214628.1 phosphotransferase [Mycolicibacterium crocinum]ULN42874.1 phosphotransferase [Mycolicibacterium crocinum]
MPFISDPELDALLDQLPALAGQPRQLEELHGGLTNRNIKITTPAATYVARCSVNATTMLGIDRDNEYYNSKAAEQAGVGAPVIDYRPDLGILLVGFLEGTTLTNADLQRPDVLARVAEGCRTLHAGPRFRDRFNMFELQPAYLKVVQERGFRIPTDYLYFTREFQAVKRILGPDEHATVPCNNDLLAGNFVDNGSKVWLIDYEYSGNNDPCFELGNIWAECGLSTDQLDELVSLYYGRRLRHKTARARLQGIIGKYGWTLWGCIQNGTSTLDFDFWEWAMERYESAVAEFRGPEFPRLLADAQAPD